MTSSVKPGVHNVSLRRQMRIKPQPQVACTKFGEDLTCSSEDMIVDRQTHTHKRTDTLSTMHSSPIGGGAINDIPRTNGRYAPATSRPNP